MSEPEPLQSFAQAPAAKALNGSLALWLAALCLAFSAVAAAAALAAVSRAPSGLPPGVLPGLAVAMGGLLGAAALLAHGLFKPLRALRLRAEAELTHSLDEPGPWPNVPGEVGRLSAAVQSILAQGQFKAEASADMLARLEAVLNYAQVGVAFSRLSHIELVSQHYCTVFACEQSEVMGQPTRIMYPSDEAYEALSARARPAFMEFGAFEGELELVRRNGERFWASMRGRAVVPGNLAMGTIWIIEDVTLAREQRERLTYNATHDALTGLANRLAFESALGKATAMVAKHSFSALFMDLDRFKQVNDTGGHAAGDALLKGIAEALHACVRGTDMVARLGGDEFAVLLPRCPEEVALNLAERMRAAVEGYALEMDGRRHTVGVSIGLVHVDERFASGADVVRAADAACYAAKHAGRNCVVAYSSLPPAAQLESPDPEAAALAGQGAPA